MLATLMALSLLGPILATTVQGPANDPEVPVFESLAGFSTVLASHVDGVMGSTFLPSGTGLPVEPGVFVTLTMERMQVFDRDVATFQAGRLVDATTSPYCRTKCPTALFDAFQRTWLELALEVQSRRLELPERILFAPDARLPARTLIQAIYAAAESRPVRPPNVAVLLNGGKAGLRAQPVALIPPGGLDLRQGSAALGLEVRVEAGQYTVRAAHPRFGANITTRRPDRLRAALVKVRKRFPGKRTVIFTPGESATVGELIGLIIAAREQFPRIVLNAGQRVVIR